MSSVLGEADYSILVCSACFEMVPLGRKVCMSVCVHIHRCMCSIFETNRANCKLLAVVDPSGRYVDVYCTLFSVIFTNKMLENTT